MNHRRPPFSRWLALALLLAAPALLILLATTQQPLGLVLGATLGVIVVAYYGGFAFWHTRTTRRALDRAEGILGDEPRSPAAWDAWTTLGELDATVERLRRRLISEKGQAALQSTTADAILNALPDPLLVIDGDRQVMRANHAARKLMGNEILGRDLAVALRHPVVLEGVSEVLSGAVALTSAEFSTPGADGRSYALRVAELPASVETGESRSQVGGAILALHDITALRKVEQMRADFVANASHELRTPLASLVGFIETLLGPARDDEAARLRFLAIMRDQAARMSRLVNDLLSLSQIEMREHDRPAGEVLLSGLLRELVAALQPQADARQISLALHLDASERPVAGARDELLQVFQNLIDNAIKYGRAGSRVDVILRASGDGQMEVAVCDQGEGIPKQHLPRLTERFYRVDSARSREMGGTGLGLAIVKHIVSRHRGRLVIESEPGVGSKFIIYIPFVHISG